MSENKKPVSIQIVSPLSGTAVQITEVPDPIFSGKMMGDGAAVIPDNGTIVAPVDGELTMIAPTLHAYGFKAEDGTEVLVHVGLETVGLDGAAFKVLKEAGSKVRKGEPVAEVDLELLKSKNLNPITAIVLTSTPKDAVITVREGKVKGGEETILTIEEPAKEEAPEADTKPASGKDEKKDAEKADKKGIKRKTRPSLPKAKRINPIRPKRKIQIQNQLRPASEIRQGADGRHRRDAGSRSDDFLGKLVGMMAGDITLVTTIGMVMENIGWAIINNLHLLFAVAIGGSWAKERAGGAFAAVIAFILINNITGQIFGVTTDMLADPNAITHTLFGQPMPVANYFVNILGAPALNMGVFIGMISGFAGAIIYNKYYNYRKLPDALAFFNGKRFVPLVVIVWSVIIALILSIFWPMVQLGINSFGEWIATSSETSPILAPFIYGTLERLLLPFGLHHMLTIPMNYTSFGGTYVIATGAQAGTAVYGQDPLWLAWVNDLINYKNAGNIAAYNELLTTVTPARFKVGQMIGATGLLLGIALAMYRRVDPDKKKNTVPCSFPSFSPSS
ncbi:glucose PTS transporter subunit IIA [Allobaculum sp. Allo2]|uniref:glucose PTS transporter subunit IIA n=1 Tax=Allobaculum sp. Allo2 TaxID=2853432 RepID=UPI001F621850|nr:glucose PTS transporter subunit IIA [Allobaculum sp. Allo2]